MPYFGYQMSVYGPPVAFKAEDKPFISAPLRKDDLEYPIKQLKSITDKEFSLSVDELKALYPYEAT